MSTTVIATLMLLFIFLALVFLRVPIVYAIGIASLVDFLYLGINPMQMALKFVSNLNSYTLLAVPFFITMGELMGAGGVTDTQYFFPYFLFPLQLSFTTPSISFTKLSITSIMSARVSGTISAMTPITASAVDRMMSISLNTFSGHDSTYTTCSLSSSN